MRGRRNQRRRREADLRVLQHVQVLRPARCFLVSVLVVVLLGTTTTRVVGFVIRSRTACERLTKKTSYYPWQSLRTSPILDLAHDSSSSSSAETTGLVEDRGASQDILVDAAPWLNERTGRLQECSALHNSVDSSRSKQQQRSRRCFLASATGVATVLSSSSCSFVPDRNVALAVEDYSTDSSSAFPAESRSLPAGLLESRVDGNVLSPPPYGMECGDIRYPSWFGGTWQVISTTVSVQAPGGVSLGFASNATYAAAQAQVGTKLAYECRFVAAANGAAAECIADREFNVRRIAQAAFGSVNCVLDIPLATPNKLTAILIPPGAPQPFQVDLFVVNRRQETVSPTRFDCSEVVREIIVAAGSGSSNSPPVLKEIETTSLYTYDAAKDSILCRQRSATYLLPSQTDQRQYRRWELAQGRPVDVRFYDVLYTRKA